MWVLGRGGVQGFLACFGGAISVAAACFGYCLVKKRFIPPVFVVGVPVMLFSSLRETGTCRTRPTEAVRETVIALR